ncbi:MAG: protein phosphatase 2C domain-containing protein [Rhodocyclaceae bacterium]|nr:protein phosphatase 2C domain-containing protein [Rhodocyclaceae bacterium]
MPFRVDTCTAQHIGDRDEQQDRVGLFLHPRQKGVVMAVVADGMGGLSGGALAAEQVLHSARHVFEQATILAASIEETLTAAINEAHASIRLAALTAEQEPHSTAAVLILQPGRADWAHCGDSRIYHVRAGAIVSKTWDHSHVMNLVRLGYLTEEQAESHPQKNLLISCLGDVEAPKIDFGTTAPLHDGDCFLLCSDGLWAYFEDDELARILTEKPVREAAETLINLARERAAGRGDNVSLAILRVTEYAEEKPSLPRRSTKK